MFAPTILTALRDYRRSDFLADVGAGVTVGVIALPLAIGFAIASGVTPQQGLWTAIIASIVVSLLGGSRFQVSGPTGAFVPILFSIVALHGYDGLALATMMAGAMLVLTGALRMGRLLKFIPYPVVAGFTSGIAVIILCGQLNEFLGLGLKMPGHVPQQLQILAANLHLLNWQALAIGLLTLAVYYAWPFLTRRVPASIVAVVVATAAAYLAGWPLATIGTRFGGIPVGLPELHLPIFSLEAMRDLMGPAFTIAALAAIESLLSAMVADGMTDTRHDPNQELVAQGIANLVCPFAGGITSTGAIARTAANIRSGARTPVSGLIHALVLVAAIFLAAPLASFIPLAALSAILLTVALRMAEWHTFVELWRGPRADFGVLFATFALTVVFDLTIGVGAGLIMAIGLFLHQMEDVTRVRLITHENEHLETGSHSIRGKDIPSDVILYRIEGPLFFGATEKLDMALRASGGKPRVVVFRMRHVPAMDASGLHAFEVAIAKLQRDRVEIFLTAVQPQPMKVMFESGLAERIGIDRFCADIDQALVAIRQQVVGA
jgi:sulfate permease, SulP family